MYTPISESRVRIDGSILHEAVDARDLVQTHAVNSVKIGAQSNLAVAPHLLEVLEQQARRDALEETQHGVLGHEGLRVIVEL